MPAVSPADKPLVLLVEDNPRTRKLAAEAFRDRDCLVAEAETAEQAVAHIQAIPGIDLIFSDLNLDRTNDYDVGGAFVHRVAQSLRPHVTFIKYSAHFQPADTAKLQSEHPGLSIVFDAWAPAQPGRPPMAFSKLPDSSIPPFLDQVAESAREGAIARQRPDPTPLPDPPYPVRQLHRAAVTQSACAIIDSALDPERNTLLLAEFELPNQIASEARSRTFAAWLIEGLGSCYVELFRRPSVRAVGDTPNDALQRLISVAFAGSPLDTLGLDDVSAALNGAVPPVALLATFAADDS